jgi:hypothetical protein
MLSLAEYQYNIAADILDGGTRTINMLPGDTAAARIAIGIHRNTVLSALVNALRLTFPTVEKLTGVDFFEQAALAFARAHPPRGPCLSDYGDGFADFLAQYAPARDVPFLADSARFDLAIERCANRRIDVCRIMVPLDDDVMLELSGSLACLSLRHPADLIRDVLDGGDDDPLSDIDMTSRPHHFAVWRGRNGASVSSLSAPAATFLDALLQGRAASSAFAAAVRLANRDDALAAIQSEVFAAPFARIATTEQE